MGESAKGHTPVLELKKPFLLTCTTVFASFFATIGLIALPAMVLVGGDHTTYAIEGTKVSREELMRRGDAFLAVLPIVVIFMGLVAYGRAPALFSWRRRSPSTR